MTSKVRVRYAPSPTGELHIGNARTALFNYLFARHYGGDFVIRIEDTDLKRNLEHGEKSQLDNLTWLGMDWDEAPNKPGQVGPYRQSERLHIYNPLIDQLLAEGKAYKCYMTEEELEAEREAQQARGEMPRSVSGDWVIRKRDGMPTYNFAVTVDDHLMGITHVLRGDDHIANTPKQMMIYDAFGWDYPRFGHMTLIVNAETHKKLSKRDGAILQFIEQYRNLGYLPEAIFNFIALLGWSPVGEEEIFGREQLIELFDYERLSTSPASFDSKKLEWINNTYMKQASLEEVTALALPHLIEAGRVSANPSEEELAWVTKVVSLFHEQMSYGAEIVSLSSLFFNDSLTIDEESREVLAGEQVPTVLAAVREKLANLEDFEAANIKACIKEVQKETGAKGRGLFMPIRIAVSGQMHGPELPALIEVLGKEKVLSHIDQVAALLA